MLFDAAGLIGVTCILGAYFLLQIGKIKVDEMPYQIINLVGAVGVLISLYKDWNLSAFLIEFIWMAISLYGIAGIFRKRRNRA